MVKRNKTEIISKKEKKTRESEINRKKNKKRDFRKWANKYLKPGAFPEPSCGIGEGKFCYCFSCNTQATKITGKTKSENKGISYYCRCGAETLTMYRSVFSWFMGLDEEQKQEFRKFQTEKEGTTNLSYTLPEE